MGIANEDLTDVELGISVVSDGAWSSMASIRFLSLFRDCAAHVQCHCWLGLLLSRSG